MIITYFIMKLTLQAILEECNRLAHDQAIHEQAARLKSRILQLELALETGEIDEETYRKGEMEVIGELSRLTSGEGGALEGY